MIQKDPIKEAKRYLKNADKVLQENCTVDKYGNYDDEKYVKTAGDLAWKSILVALEPLHPKVKGKRRNVDTYREVISKKNRQLLKVYKNAYNQLHLDMGYDGITDTKIKKAGWYNAKILIDWADKHLPKPSRVGLSGKK